MNLRLDTSKKKLEMFFKTWQVEALRYLWSIMTKGAKSKTVWENVNDCLQDTISRASIINFLNAMVDESLILYTEVTGKGGHYRVYRIKYTEPEFKHHLAGLMISKLLIEFPEETRKVLSNLTI